MRIDGSNIIHIGDRAGTAAGTHQSAETRREARPAAVVDLGAAASRSRDSDALPPDVAQRLEEVRVQLAEGNYALDFDRLAERMADEEIARAGR